jgi:hypothetical protein
MERMERRWTLKGGRILEVQLAKWHMKKDEAVKRDNKDEEEE